MPVRIEKYKTGEEVIAVYDESTGKVRDYIVQLSTETLELINKLRLPGETDDNVIQRLIVEREFSKP